MPHGVDRSCLGTIERVFSTTRQFGVHRQGLNRALGRFRWKKFLLWCAAVLIVITMVAFAILVLSGTPLDRFTLFFYWGNAIFWVFSMLLGVLLSVMESKQDAAKDFNDLAALHDSLPPVAWEVRLETGETVILKGFSGQRGDQVGVNFIGDWTPSIVNFSDIGRGAEVREQLALDFQISDQSSLFPWPDEYRLFVEGEAARIKEYELRIRKTLNSIIS